MNIITINVPSGIRYISDWFAMIGGYDLKNFSSHHILNKILTGCGFTEYCIRNDQDLVLLSPRRLLLSDKIKQHLGEFNILYAKNDLEEIVDYEKDISDKGKKSRSIVRSIMEDAVKTPNPDAAQKILELKDKIRQHIEMCKLSHVPFKILVTYDSFRHVKEVLQELGLLHDTQIVVDEFQSIFIDSRFKASTELELLHLVRDIPRVCYVSATPMLDKYLNMLDEFKNLPYFQFDWSAEEPGRVIKPTVNVKFVTRGLGEELTKIIEDYRGGRYEKRRYIDLGTGMPYEIVSNEAVFFFNSVGDICTAIKKNKLTPLDTNVICADIPDNEKKLKAAFDSVFREVYPDNKKMRTRYFGKLVGDVPLKGQQHKMFTFCTRTVYLGADFYSTCARTFVFSDSNIDCLSVDVSIDLEQILGRQRLNENPWKNTANLYVKTTGKHYTLDDFNNRLNSKTNSTNMLLNVYQKGDMGEKHALSVKYESDIKGSSYKNDYVAVNNHAGSDKIPVFNHLVMVSEIRAFDVQQMDYADRFSVLNTLHDSDINETVISDIEEYFNRFSKFTQFTDKMKFVVDAHDELEKCYFDRFLSLLPDKKFSDYFIAFGPKRIKALDYREIDLEREWDRLVNNRSLDDDLKNRIYSSFSIGSRYTRVYIKDILQNIYNDLGYKATPKALDLQKYFTLKAVTIIDKVTKKKDNGFELISKIDNNP